MQVLKTVSLVICGNGAKKYGSLVLAGGPEGPDGSIAVGLLGAQTSASIFRHAVRVPLKWQGCQAAATRHSLSPLQAQQTCWVAAGGLLLQQALAQAPDSRCLSGTPCWPAAKPRSQ